MVVASFLGLHLTGDLNAGELFVAAGTFALAVVTGWLAFTTRRSVKTAEESVQAERATVDAMNMPYVVAQTIGRLPDRLTLLMQLANLGAGPAIVTNVKLTEDESAEYSSINNFPLGAQESWEIRFPGPPWPEDDTTSKRAGILRIYYSDANGKAYVTTSTVSIESDAVRPLDFPRSPIADD